nr:NAD(P)(+) transhydrogenase (Re/Si-specific) subunit beta [Chitinophagaceae bacterium]
MAISILTFIYLVASVSYILGLKMLSHPETARRGNLIAAAGMTLAIFGTIFLYKDEEVEGLVNWTWIFAALILGTIAGWFAAKRVAMTAMPEMVSLFNGMGGACAALIIIIEFNHYTAVHHLEGMEPATLQPVTLLIILLGLIIGTVSFAGSMVAWAKL